MKRLVAILLSMAMLLSLCGCTKISKDNGGNDGIKVDEGLLTVEITMPASFFDEDETEETIKQASEENGFTSCTINEDGSVTYKMTKAKRNEFLKSYKEELEVNFQELINEEDSSFDKIEFNKDMTEFTAYINSNYSDFDALTVLVFYLEGAYYQIFAGADPETLDVKVKFIDPETNEIVLESSYQEWISETEEAE